MTNMRPMSESEGEFTKEAYSERPCPKCQQRKVVCRLWESSCGGYEDEKFTCMNCKYVWWIDGIDS